MDLGRRKERLSCIHVGGFVDRLLSIQLASDGQNAEGIQAEEVHRAFLPGEAMQETA